MRQATRQACILLVLLGSITLVGCDDDSGDDPILLRASCTGTTTGSASPRVLLECNSAVDSLVTIDLFAENITDEMDGYNILINFNPSVFRYTGFVSSAEPFTQDCTDNDLDCRDNLSTANDNGMLTYSVQIFGIANPTGVVVGAGNRVALGQFTFQAVAASSTGLTFNNAVGVAACDPASGTLLFNFNPACLAFGFESLGGINFENSGVTLSAVPR